MKLVGLWDVLDVMSCVVCLCLIDLTILIDPQIQGCLKL